MGTTKEYTKPPPSYLTKSGELKAKIKEFLHGNNWGEGVMWSFFTLIQTNHTRKKGTTRFAWVTPFISQNLGVTTANFLKFAWNHWLEGVLCGCFSINFCFIYPLIIGDHKILLGDPLVPQKMVKTPPPTQIMRVESLNLYFFLKILPIYKLDKLPFTIIWVYFVKIGLVEGAFLLIS